MNTGRKICSRRIARLQALLACLAFLGFVPASPALDLEAQFDFSIAPQKLTSALVELSRQANAQVVSDTTEVDRFDSSGIRGRVALKVALRALLEGTNLDYMVTDKGVIAIGAFAHGSSARGADNTNATDAASPGS